MRLLSDHPRIVTFRVHPYEARALSYWIHNVFKGHEVQHPRPNPVYTINQQWVDHHLSQIPALRQWFRREYVERLAAFAQESIDECYLQIARQHRHPAANLSGAPSGASAPLYFAEKIGPGYLPELTWEIYPGAREIVLVRDFRDMFCSILNFTDKSGSPGDFGRDRGKSEDEFIAYTLSQVETLHKSWRQRQDHAYLLRYEDLILRPEETLGRLLDYLGLAHSAAEVKALLRSASRETNEMRQHRTSGDAQASVGRWKRDLPANAQNALTEKFGEYLQAFGYTL
jgi:hypothetical protein